LNFLDRFSKNNLIPSLIKILPVGAEFFHVGRQTDNGQKNDEAKSGIFTVFRKHLKIHAQATAARK